MCPQFWWGNNFNHNRCPMQVACHRQIAKGLPCEWPVWTRATRIAKVSLHPFLWSPMDTLAHCVIVIHWAYAVGWPQAPSFWDPNSTREARFSEGTGPFASHLANGAQNVQVLVCLDALWVRRRGRKSRQVRRHHLSGQAVWACLWKNHVYFASHNNQTNAVHAACGTVETNRSTLPHPNPIVETKYTYITLLVIQQNYGKLPICRWFNHIYYNYMFLSKMIFHSYIKLPDGIWLAVQNWADLGPGSGAYGYSPGPRISEKASPANGQCGPGLRESRRFPFIPFVGAQWTH